MLAFAAAPDFETPTDAGTNNVYNVQVQVSDGTNTDTQDIAVTVTECGGFTDTGDTKLGSTSLHFVIDPRANYLRTNSDPSAINFTAISWPRSASPRAMCWSSSRPAITISMARTLLSTILQHRYDWRLQYVFNTYDIQ